MKLKLEISEMYGSMVIDTPAKGSVTTTSVCLSCPLSIFGRDFGIDLVCLPLVQIDVILGMNWLVFNRVSINCFDKTVIFPEIEGGKRPQLGIAYIYGLQGRRHVQCAGGHWVIIECIAKIHTLSFVISRSSYEAEWGCCESF